MFHGATDDMQQTTISIERDEQIYSSLPKYIYIVVYVCEERQCEFHRQINPDAFFSFSKNRIAYVHVNSPLFFIFISVFLLLFRIFFC